MRLNSIVPPDGWERLADVASWVWRIALAVLAGMGIKSLSEGVRWFMGPRFKITLEQIIAPELKAQHRATEETLAAALDMRRAAAESREAAQKSTACIEELQKVLIYMGAVEHDALEAIERAEENAKLSMGQLDDMHLLLDRLLGIDRRDEPPPEDARQGFADIARAIRDRRKKELRPMRRSAGLDSGIMPAITPGPPAPEGE